MMVCTSASSIFSRISQWMLAREDADAFLFVIGEPMVAWHPGVVFVDFAKAQLPIVEFAGSDADPGEEAARGDVRLVGPRADEVNDLIAGVMGNPASSQ